MCYHKSLCDLAEFIEMWSQIINFKNEAFAMAHSFMPSQLILSTTETFKAPSGEHWPQKEDSTELWRTLVTLPWKSESESGQPTVVIYKGQGLAFGAISNTQGYSERADQRENLKEPRTRLPFLHQELVTWSRLRQTVSTSATTHPTSSF